MVATFIELELEMERIVDSDFHFHGCNFLFLLCLHVVIENCEIYFLGDVVFDVTVNQSSEKIPHSPRNAIKSFILFFESAEFKVVLLAFGEKACRLELFGKGMKLC